MTALEDWGVPLAVLAMLLLTLVMAAILARYQAYQADVRVVVRHLAAGVAELVAALGELRTVPLSRELRLTLRSEVLARYRKIRRLYRRYPGIADAIAEAETALNSEGPTPGGGVGPLENEQVFRKTVAALDYLLNTLGGTGTLQPVPADVRAIFRRELGERRAEVESRYHLTEASRHASQGNLTYARTHLTTLVHVLRGRGPSTDFVRELYAAADAALMELTEGPWGADPKPADADVA